MLFPSVIRTAMLVLPTMAQNTFTTASNPKFAAKSLWYLYNQQLTTNPVLTKCLTAGLIAIAADVTCQTLFPENPEDRKKPWTERYNFRRTATFTLINTFIFPPITHYWYGMLSTRIIGTDVLSAVKRVAIDQSTFGPLNIALFLAGNKIACGEVNEVWKTLKRDLWPVVSNNYLVWIPAQLFNFYMIPPPFRVLWTNVVGFFWSIYVSSVAYKKAPTIEEPDKREPKKID